MNEEQANKIAEILGGCAWNSGGEIWLVRIERSDGNLVLISDEAVCEYMNKDEIEACKPGNSIILVNIF